MFDHILKNATLPGAFANATSVSRDRDLEEKRRSGGNEGDNTPKPDRKPVPLVVLARLRSILTRGPFEPANRG